MKKLLILPAFVISVSLGLNAFAQEPVLLEGEQAIKGKEITDKYKEDKAELELQLQKLKKDRDVAIRDQNTSLVDKRDSDIAETKEKLRELSLEYKMDLDNLANEHEDTDLESSDFYAEELAADETKMDAVDDENNYIGTKVIVKKHKPKKHPSKKADENKVKKTQKQPVKKSTAKNESVTKKQAAKKDNEVVIPHDGNAIAGGAVAGSAQTAQVTKTQQTQTKQGQ